MRTTRKLMVLTALVGMISAMLAARMAAGGDIAMGPFLVLVMVVLVGMALAARRRAEVAELVDAELGVSGRRAHLRRERAILRAAVRNAGRVTPAQAALAGDDLSIAEAKEILDSLAKQGLCAIDSDSRGQVFYDFSLAVGEPGAELSPDEWVEAAASRMTGRDERPTETTESA